MIYTGFGDHSSSSLKSNVILFILMWISRINVQFGMIKHTHDGHIP